MDTGSWVIFLWVDITPSLIMANSELDLLKQLNVTNASTFTPLIYKERDITNAIECMSTLRF